MSRNAKLDDKLDEGGATWTRSWTSVITAIVWLEKASYICSENLPSEEETTPSGGRISGLFEILTQRNTGNGNRFPNQILMFCFIFCVFVR